ncbi:MAG: hypothetical protein WD993_00205 [Thermoleophilaceae bacterium]
MSSGGRIALIAAAVAAVVVAFVVVQPGDDDGPANAGDTAPQPLDPGQVTDVEPTATAPSAPEPPPDGPDPAVTARLDLRGHAPVGGPTTIEASKGDRVRLVVVSDQADDIHVHGYDVELSVGPRTPARAIFEADVEGIFEIESHEAEHAGKDPLIAHLVVEPS